MPQFATLVGYNAGMSCDEVNTKRWQFGVRDLLLLMTAVAIEFATIGYAVKNLVTTGPQFLMLVAGWLILAGSTGAFFWWLRNGTTEYLIDGFLLGVLLALLTPLFLFSLPLIL